MPAFDYTRARATATRLLERFGQSAQLRKTTQIGGEPWDPASGTQWASDTDVTVAILTYQADEVDGSVITSQDRRVFVAADGSIDIRTSDALVIGGVAFQVLDVTPLSPAGTVVYFEIQARA